VGRQRVRCPRPDQPAGGACRWVSAWRQRSSSWPPVAAGESGIQRRLRTSWSEVGGGRRGRRCRAWRPRKSSALPTIGEGQVSRPRALEEAWQGVGAAERDGRPRPSSACGNSGGSFHRTWACFPSLPARFNHPARSAQRRRPWGGPDAGLVVALPAGSGRSRPLPGWVWAPVALGHALHLVRWAWCPARRA